jgi:hypothetical protein
MICGAGNPAAAINGPTSCKNYLRQEARALSQLVFSACCRARLGNPTSFPGRDRGGAVRSPFQQPVQKPCGSRRTRYKTVGTRYRINLEQERYAASAINLRVAADAGLLSPDLAAGIHRVKRAKKHGVRLGNWLTSEQGKPLLAVFDRGTVRSKRDYAMIAVILGCGHGARTSPTTKRTLGFR